MSQAEVTLREPEELSRWLRENPDPVRVVGHRSGDPVALGPAPEAAVSLRFAAEGIEDLSPGDLTCTAWAGTAREDLDRALAPHGLELSCPGGRGSLGGLFARGDHRWGGDPRSQLLGLDGVCADGRRFRSGAKVVKSVAGFDLHKPFVGSRGQLFIATRLFLRLRPSAPSRWAFGWCGEELGTACDLFLRLRNGSRTPHGVRLHRTTEGTFWLGVEFTGSRPGGDDLRDLREDADGPDPLFERGQILLTSRSLLADLPALDSALPTGAAWDYWGTGALDLSVPGPRAAETMALLQRHDLSAAVQRGPEELLGQYTPAPAGVTALEARLRAIFDPGGRLR